MLVLTRRPNHDTDDPDDTIILHDKRTGETITVSVQDVRGDSGRRG